MWTRRPNVGHIIHKLRTTNNVEPAAENQPKTAAQKPESRWEGEVESRSCSEFRKVHQPGVTLLAPERVIFAEFQFLPPDGIRSGNNHGCWRRTIDFLT